MEQGYTDGLIWIRGTLGSGGSHIWRGPYSSEALARNSARALFLAYEIDLSGIPIADRKTHEDRVNAIQVLEWGTRVWQAYAPTHGRWQLNRINSLGEWGYQNPHPLETAGEEAQRINSDFSPDNDDCFGPFAEDFCEAAPGPLPAPAVVWDCVNFPAVRRPDPDVEGGFATDPSYTTLTLDVSAPNSQGWKPSGYAVYGEAVYIGNIVAANFAHEAEPPYLHLQGTSNGGTFTFYENTPDRTFFVVTYYIPADIPYFDVDGSPGANNKISPLSGQFIVREYIYGFNCGREIPHTEPRHTNEPPKEPEKTHYTWDGTCLTIYPAELPASTIKVCVPSFEHGKLGDIGITTDGGTFPPYLQGIYGNGKFEVSVSLAGVNIDFGTDGTGLPPISLLEAIKEGSLNFQAEAPQGST